MSNQKWYGEMVNGADVATLEYEASMERMLAHIEADDRIVPDNYTCPLCGKEHPYESLNYRWVNKRYKHLTDGYYRPRLSDNELWLLPDGESVVCTDRSGCRDRKALRAAKLAG